MKIQLAALLVLLQPFAVAAAQEPAAKAEAKADKAKPKIQLLKPAGAYADLPEMAFSPTSLLTGGGTPPKAFYPLIDAIDAMAKDEAKTCMLDLTGSPHFNLAQVREVERALQRLRGTGKKIVAYLEGADPVTYQIAAQADRVLLAEMGAIDLRSPSLSTMHMKDALDLLGIQVEVTRVGEFKGAVEPFLLPQMSEHLREHYRKMLASMNDDVVRRIATGRRLDGQKVRELQARRLFTGKEALAAGLVDALVPWEGAQRALQKELGNDDFELVDAVPKKKGKRGDLLTMLSEMFKSKKEAELEDTPQLVVLHLAGAIVDGDKPSPGSMVSGPSVKLIDQLTASEHVKGVVVRINSPGGSATASEAIRKALERLAAKKSVVLSMGELAASGGYWITCIGRPIFAEVGTITGSIGVFSMRFQPGALFRRLGVHPELVALDDGALMDAMDQPWTEGARAHMQAFVDEIYDRFVQYVATSRKLGVEDVRKIAGGRVWSGSQGVELRLVDRVGGLQEALAELRKQAGQKDDVEVVHLPSPRNFADSILENLFEGSALAKERLGLAALLERCGGAEVVAMLLQEALAADGGGKVWALLPAVPRVR